jgi:hypothetical protein
LQARVSTLTQLLLVILVLSCSCSLFAHAFVLFLVSVFPLTPGSYAQYQSHSSVSIRTHSVVKLTHLPSASSLISAFASHMLQCGVLPGPEASGQPETIVDVQGWDVRVSKTCCTPHRRTSTLSSSSWSLTSGCAPRFRTSAFVLTALQIVYDGFIAPISDDFATL